MARRIDRRTLALWGAPAGALLFGIATVGLAAARGRGLELIWLPAVLLAAAWPNNRRYSLRSCLRRARHEG